MTGYCLPSLFHLKSSKCLAPINALHSRWGVPTEQSRETEARRHSLGFAVSHPWGLEPRNPDAQAAGQVLPVLLKSTSSCARGF